MSHAALLRYGVEVVPPQIREFLLEIAPANAACCFLHCSPGRPSPKQQRRRTLKFSKPAAETYKQIPANSKLYIAPMNGYETFLAAALTKKGVPVLVVSDRANADFEVKGSSESQKAGVAKMLIMGSVQSYQEASITVTNVQSGVLIFAYEVSKGNSVHGKQSTAEACAKHLKEKIESGK